jgi:hypothetical protein
LIQRQVSDSREWTDELFDHFRYSKDCVSLSTATAAAAMLGRSANERTQWKDAKGRALKALRVQEASG